MYQTILALDAVNATATSNKFYVGGAKRIGFMLRRTNHSAGSTALSVNISAEDENTVAPTMSACNMLIPNLIGSNAQTVAHVASISSGTANGDFYCWLDPLVMANWVSVTATETTDGNHTVFIILEYEE